jgi:CHAT domain-containing protein
VINVAAAMQYAGWRHIIGTLWSMWDDAASGIARDVYDTLTAEGRFEPARSAAALHAAVRGLRRRHPLRPSVWAPFVHIGP